MEEFKQLLNNLEDEYRHDLSLHLYSTFLLHRVNPFLPVKHWAAWPLPADEVPDPRTCRQYMDEAADKTWAPETNVFGVIENKKRNREEIDHEKAKKKSKLGPNDTDEVLQPSEESSDNEEADLTVEEAARRDALAILNEDSEGSPSDSEDEPEILSGRKKSIPIVNLKYKQTPTDHRANLLVEVRALIHKKIRLRISEMPDMRGKDIVLDFDDHLTETMAKDICAKTDGLLHALGVGPKKKELKARKVLNWRNLLIANLNNPNGDSANIETTDRTYERCKRLFDSVRFNYQYKCGVSDTEFSFGDYIDKIRALRTRSPSHRNLVDRVLKGRQEAAEEKTQQEHIYKALLENKRRDLNLSWNLGHIRGGMKGKRKRDVTVVKIGVNNAADFVNKALEHNGVRLDASEYYMDI